MRSEPRQHASFSCTSQRATHLHCYIHCSQERKAYLHAAATSWSTSAKRRMPGSSCRYTNPVSFEHQRASTLHDQLLV